MSEQALCDSEKIVALLKAGDVEVLDRVTRCYGDRLLSAARRHCRNEEEAQDAVQDAALGAWRYGESYRGEGRVDRWLVRLVATACNRMRRGQKNDPALHIRDTELEAADASPEALAGRSELAEALAGALQELDPRDRAILLLADAQGFKGPEIAEALDLSHAAVRARLSRTHRRLRERLERVGVVVESD